MNTTFRNLKPHIADAIKEYCQIQDTIVFKIADEVHRINTVTVEPGVEIAEDLSMIIDATIKDSVCLGCDLKVVSKGILIGAFRSHRSMPMEAHKTIHLLIQEIIQPVFNYKGDINKAVAGLLAGITVIAREHNLNVQEALIVAREDIFLSMKKIDDKLADDIKVFMQEIKEWS